MYISDELLEFCPWYVYNFPYFLRLYLTLAREVSIYREIWIAQ